MDGSELPAEEELILEIAELQAEIGDISEQIKSVREGDGEEPYEGWMHRARMAMRKRKGELGVLNAQLNAAKFARISYMKAAKEATRGQRFNELMQQQAEAHRKQVAKLHRSHMAKDHEANAVMVWIRDTMPEKFEEACAVRDAARARFEFDN